MADDLFLAALLPTTHDLGGFKVHRTLPHRERTTVGPFIFFDQMGPAQLPPGKGIDVRPHPHINLATVTYLFAGAIEHRDSLGTFARIEPGAVNLMTAGSGIAHSRALARRRSARERARAFGHPDLARACPTAKEEMDPAFEHVARDDLPMVEGGGARARVVMGSFGAGPRRSPATARPSMPTSISRPAARCRSMPRRTSARSMSRRARRALDGLPLERRRLYVLRPGDRRHPALGGGRPCHALRRRPARRAAPRLVELRLLAPRADPAGQGGLARRPLPAPARRS